MRTDDMCIHRLSHEELQKLIGQNQAWFERLTAQGRSETWSRAWNVHGVIVSGRNGRFIYGRAVC